MKSPDLKAAAPPNPAKPDRHRALAPGKPEEATPPRARPPLDLRSADPATLPIASLERDAAINCREGGVDERLAAEYAEALAAGAAFPPVVVFRDAAGAHRLADGFHRVRAHELAGKAEVPVELREGDRRAALLFATGANAGHGARRNKNDVRRAVRALLGDAEWREWSDREIAAQCAVSPTTVGKLRKQLSTVDSSSPRRGKDGKVRRSPKRGNPRRRRPGTANPAKLAKAARRSLDRVEKSWPKGQPLGPLVAEAREWARALSQREGAASPAGAILGNKETEE
jgi:ParB-like chromosome segregation protein Spo0J